MACSFEKINKFENAIRWFNHVLNVTPIPDKEKVKSTMKEDTGPKKG